MKACFKTGQKNDTKTQIATNNIEKATVIFLQVFCDFL